MRISAQKCSTNAPASLAGLQQFLQAAHLETKTRLASALSRSAPLRGSLLAQKALVGALHIGCGLYTGPGDASMLLGMGFSTRSELLMAARGALRTRLLIDDTGLENLAIG